VIRAPRALSLILSCALASSGANAWADAAADNKQLATDLFDKAVKKMEAGKCDQQPISDREACAEARDLFRRSYEIYPAGLGALRNLAYVELGLGLLASAARSFRELERKAPDDPNPKRHVWAEYAQKELASLEPRIPHVTLVVPKEHPAALEVSLDGAIIPPPAWGTTLDVDPGTHVVRAKTAACPPFEISFEVAEKESRSVDVSACAAAKPVEAPKPASPPSRVPPLVFMGIGGASVIVGLVFGATAISKKSDACGDGDLCDPRGLEDARTAARTSTILTGAGLALVAGGAVWYLLTPATASADHATRVSPWAGPGALGLLATGSF